MFYSIIRHENPLVITCLKQTNNDKYQINAFTWLGRGLPQLNYEIRQEKLGKSVTWLLLLQVEASGASASALQYYQPLENEKTTGFGRSSTLFGKLSNVFVVFESQKSIY